MSWIGLRDHRDGQFRPGGLDADTPLTPAEDGVLARGSVQLECSYVRGTGAITLLHYDTEVPWPVRFTLFFDASGTLHLGHRVGSHGTWLRLDPGLSSPTDGIIITYAWDAPERRAWLSLYHPESDLFCHADLQGPMPLCLRDVRRMSSLDSGVSLGGSVEWLGLADHIAPMGPVPGLSGGARVKMSNGTPRRIDRVAVGDRLATVCGAGAIVRWIGSAALIARGRWAPLRLRAPYHDLQRDMEVSKHQRLLIAGSNVEYLFGVEEVSAAAGHLADRRSVLPAPTRPVVRYWQVVLDRPATLIAEGCAVESFDPGPILDDPSARPLTVLANLPSSLLPQRAATVPVLQGFEAMTLAHAGAA